jgi:hypothetical protein
MVSLYFYIHLRATRCSFRKLYSCSMRSPVTRNTPFPHLCNVLFLLLLPLLGWGQRSITASGTVSETFNTLSSSGSSGTTLPQGFFFSETGTGANTTYGIDNGSDNTGNTYSYGTGASADRSLGSLQSGTLFPLIGAAFTNNTGATITQLNISYTGEQWRLGSSGNRTDQLIFAYSTNANSLTTGTYTNVSSLTFVTPNLSGSAGTRNGNIAANNTPLTGTISGLSIANGTTFYLRWTDDDAIGADDGLAIDDFSLTAVTSSAPAPTINVTPSVLTGFLTNTGTPSAAQTYQVSGANLSGNTSITVTPPVGYQVGLGSSPAIYASSLVIPQTSAGAVAATTVSVRLNTSVISTYGTPAAPTYLTNESGPANRSVALDGAVVSATAPTLQVTPASLSGFTYLIGTGPSASQSYTLSGTNLLSGNVAVSVPSNARGGYDYEISFDNITFGPTAITSQTGGTLRPIPVYVRLRAGLLIGNYNGQLISNGGGGANNTAQVTVNGSVTGASVFLPSTTTLTGFSTVAGTASAVQSYALTGSLLPGGGIIRAMLPTGSGYEISADNITFGQIADLTYTGASLPTTPAAQVPRVYVRLAASASPGTYNGVVLTNTILTSLLVPTSITNTVTLSGTVGVAPTISTTAVSPGVVMPGSSVTVTYATTGAFVSGNAFTAELSTAAGTFPGTVLTATASGAGSLTATIPVGTVAGTAYTIRVNGSSPAVSGTASPAFTVTGGVFEPFEQTSIGGSYLTTPTSFTFQSGTWTMFQAVNGITPGTDAFNGARSIRLRGGGYAQYAKANGVGTLSLSAATFGNDANVSFTLQYSTDGGASFIAVPGTVPAGSLAGPGPNHTFSAGPYSYTLNVTGAVLIRIGTTNLAVGTTSARINIDDVSITDYTSTVPALIAVSDTLTVAASSGQVTTTSYILTGQNLPAATTASISSNNPAVLVSVDGGVTYAATATSAPATAAGNLNQTVLVQFTATSSNISAIIANSIAGAGLSAPVVVTGSSLPVVTYTWTGATSTSWSDPTNWTPIRTRRATADILVFNGSSTPTPSVLIDFVSAQTIGQLQFINNVNATFNTPNDAVLTISNLATGADFSIASGSQLSVYNPGASTTAAGLTLQLGTGATASIAGTMVFDAATSSAAGTGAHQLLGSGVGSIDFLGSSVFRAGANFSGSPFGDASATALVSAVTFRNGARYEQFGGQNPFALSQPASIVVFEPDSYYYLGVQGGTPPSLSGRTYGILEYNVGNGNTNTSTVANPVTINGDLIISSGNIGMSLSGGVNIKGDILVNGGSTLTFDPSSGAIVQFGGTATQSIGGTAPGNAVIFGANATMQINNAAGLMLNRPLTVSHLTLTNGIITTTATNLLTLTSRATVLPAVPTAVSFVNGPLARTTVAGAGVTLFPIGKGTAYRPLTLTATSQNAASTYTAEQFEGNPGQNLAPGNGLGNAPLQRVSFKRSYTVTSSNTVPGNFSGTITLSFGPDDYVNMPSSSDLVIGKRDAVGTNAGLWTNISNSAYTGGVGAAGGPSLSGTLTSGVFSNFSDFALGAQNDLASTNVLAATNPLPVELSDFDAARQASTNAVSITWATASEKSSARFEVQRSLNALEFVTVATVVAQGTSTKVTTYAALDKTAPAALLYYRLRQVDLDGTVSYSPVILVNGASEAAKVELYPNPAHSTISFITGAILPYRVLNQLGQPLLRGTTEVGTTKVVIEQLPVGLYFLEMQTATGRVVQKFEKE